nr:putative ribonuclease H-like domain-containing protein [Tanacetum cinerariifolium]
LHAVKRIFRYLNGKPHLGLWYPKDSLFDLVANSDSDYAGASLDRKSTTRGCQFLGCRLISWQCKKQTVVATSSTKIDLLAMQEANSCCHFIHKVKQVNDITRLQALVDKKKVVVIEATIREALRLDDAEGVDYLPNEEIFAELARMGYEKPSTKLTFYKAHQWHLLSYVYPQGDEEGEADEHVKEVSAGDAAEGDDSAAHGEVPTIAKEQSIPSLIPPTPPPQPPQDIPSTSQVQQTPPQSPQVQPPLPLPQAQQAVEFPMSLLQEAMDACAALNKRVEHLEFDKVAQALEITKLNRRVKKLERRNKVRLLKLISLQKVGTSQRVESSDDSVMDDESNQERMIAEMDQGDAVVLEHDKEEDREVADADKDVEEAKEDETDPPEVQEVVDKLKFLLLLQELLLLLVEEGKECSWSDDPLVTSLTHDSANSCVMQVVIVMVILVVVVVAIVRVAVVVVGSSVSSINKLSLVIVGSFSYYWSSTCPGVPISIVSICHVSSLCFQSSSNAISNQLSDGNLSHN